MTEPNQRYLRYAIMIADRAREHGNQPFGALLQKRSLKRIYSGRKQRITKRKIRYPFQVTPWRKTYAIF